MSKISEQKALGAYPKMSRISETHRVIPADNKSHRFGDANEENREAFIKGYDQAMQDIKQYVEKLIRHEEKELGEHNVDFGLYTILGHIVKIEENE